MKKQMMLAIGAAGMLTVLATGCKSVETNRVGDQLKVDMPVYIQPEVQTADKQINGDATVHSVLGIFSWGPNKQAVGVDFGTGAPMELFAFASGAETLAKNAAVYNAVTSAEADLVLAPQYVLTVDDYFVYKSVNCKVKGYPGFLKSLKVVGAPQCCAPCNGK